MKLCGRFWGETRQHWGLQWRWEREWERIMCIYTVSLQERGREPRRRPDRCTNIASNHRDPLHEGENGAVMQDISGSSVSARVRANIPAPAPSVTLKRVRRISSSSKLKKELLCTVAVCKYIFHPWTFFPSLCHSKCSVRIHANP